ncbi:MAG: hypothetical protein L6Q52_06570 [Rhodocyclaceae bacterium]|nr:hypothetical protein [Rhodocyclaceae bacterium]
MVRILSAHGVADCVVAANLLRQVLIDHKSTQQSAEHWEHLANDHGAQLMAYGEAIRLATGREIKEFWLFLPVAGGAVRLDADASRG